MSFHINISGHVNGEVEAARAFEEKLVTDLRALITEVESYGHNISGSFTGQHLGVVTLQTPIDQEIAESGIQVAPDAETAAPAEEGDAAPTEAPAP